MNTAQLTFQDEGTRAESVTEFTRRVKLVLETGVRPSWIRGEVSNLRAQASGHVYFSLKDAGAQISAVLFRGDGVRQTGKLRDGKKRYHTLFNCSSSQYFFFPVCIQLLNCPILKQVRWLNVIPIR